MSELCPIYPCPSICLFFRAYLTPGGAGNHWVSEFDHPHYEAAKRAVVTGLLYKFGAWFPFLPRLIVSLFIVPILSFLLCMIV